MRKSIASVIAITGVFGLACLPLCAEPELRGTASDLAHYISDVPKTVIVAGEAEVRVPAHRAVVSLRVIAENKSLQEAMRSNQELRGKVADFLINLGLDGGRIQTSRFSSTPKFGMFGDKAKSYRVENQVRVFVQDEKEFQSVAGAVDKWAEVQYDGVEFEYADKEAQKQAALVKACDNADERKKIYEQKLGFKLTATRFNEEQVFQRDAMLRNSYIPNTIMSGLPASSGKASDAVVEATDSFGEIVYTAHVAVEYAVQTK